MKRQFQKNSIVESRTGLGLTPRESEVVGLVADGLSSREVAQRLCRSPRTIENHLRSIYQKLGVRNRVELVRAAGEGGLLELLGESGGGLPAAELEVKGRTLDLISQIDARMARVAHRDYFFELGKALTEVLGVRWAGVTEPKLREDMLDIICVVERGESRDQIECRASVSPCGSILKDEEIVVGDGLAEQFPNWELGHRLGVRGYVGVLLKNHLGEPSGTLWIMHDGAIEEVADYVMILRLFGRRTSSELTMAQLLDGAGGEAGASGPSAAAG